MDIHIAICDDEQIQCDYLYQLITRWSQYSKQRVSISLYASAEEFQFAWSEDKSFAILLLDVQMGGKNGIELAKAIRQTDDTLQIVFITGYPDFIAEGYEVSALHYLMKPVNEQKLFEVLERAVSRMQVTKRTILFEVGHSKVRIAADNIYYVEAFSHYVTLYTKDSQQSFNMRISDMEKTLGEDFFRCHRSYIVGMKHVSKVTRNVMILDSGKEIPLSRAKYDDANQAFIHYN